ncbi:hypothetical protein GQ43DRAFT_443340 [Delitschia confertaspora ATCC 74209]|uniref:Uncharacterized protein n=1 Tax=Delitschia confertaspora ATCC 74209 TaxID=1513339 RepID=A0A9P4JG10_9PLEO|nr:hypothetical protein GQ43DRAFT_443340 [Delitschia confertaspora ATCC 74209]
MDLFVILLCLLASIFLPFILCLSSACNFNLSLIDKSLCLGQAIICIAQHIFGFQQGSYSTHKKQ